MWSRAAAPDAPTWLGATSVHSRDPNAAQVLRNTLSMCDHYRQLHFLVNFFDAGALDPAATSRRLLGGQAHARVVAVQVPGMKTLFWKRSITPALLRSRRVQLLWLVDSDISSHPSSFPLGVLAGILATTRATLLQPSIRAAVHGTPHAFLRVRQAHMSCVATTAGFVELQTPLFAPEAWAAFHERVLARVADADLADSDYGIDITWCAPRRRRRADESMPMNVTAHWFHADECDGTRRAAAMHEGCACACACCARALPPVAG